MKSANSLKGIKVADPFMGGGTPLIEANRLGCEIARFDIGSIAGDTGTTGKCSMSGNFSAWSYPHSGSLG